MHTHNQSRGGTLLAALIAVLVVATSLGIAISTTGTTARMSDRGRDYVRARLAAEGAVEYAFGIWKKRLQNQDAPISTKDAEISHPPALSGFDYSSKEKDGGLAVQATDRYGTPMGSAKATPVPVMTSVPGYPGWHGNSFYYLASVRVSQSSPRGAPLNPGVKRRFAYVEVPLFQSMFFYEHDLELYKPAPMIISGLVHTNSNLYLMAGQSGSPAVSNLIFQDHVSHVGHYYAEDQPAPYNIPAPRSSLWSSYSGPLPPPDYTNGGFDAQVHQVQRYEPLGPDPAGVINNSDANQNNDSLRELIEPPVDGKLNPDPPQIAKRRLYNQAGIIITINGPTATPAVTLATQNGTKLTPDQEKLIKSAVTGKTTIYDQREGYKVDVANVNIGTLIPTLDAA
ncbi:MAG: hypothetical protein JWL90_566, partial [Chthoniobacteraceae bacterium]|nr:hypothetical protein [Chthoniobacteraceae bacterium]